METINNFVNCTIHRGYGSGSGDGSGYGSGNGNGYGSSDGSGYGSGYGSSDGDGNGSGDGSGRGYGSGRGIGRLNSQTIYRIDEVPTIITHIHGNFAKGYILSDDFTKSPCFVAKNGNLFAHGETLRGAQEALREKLFGDMDNDERVDAFLEEVKPSTKYPAKLFFDWHNRLTGSCLMGRREFCKSKGIDIEADTLTLEEFVALTANAYGSEVIAKVKERIKNENME